MVETAVARLAVAASREVAFATLVGRHLDEAYRLAALILGDALEAEDAVHDAAVIAWRRWDSLREPDRFEAWFTRILVNGCRDRLRRRRRRPVVDLGRVIEAGGEPAVADRSSAIVDRLVVGRAVASLGPDERIVIALRYWRDLPIEEIAWRIDAPVGTVKSRLHRAHRQLRAALEAHDEEARR